MLWWLLSEPLGYVAIRALSFTRMTYLGRGRLLDLILFRQASRATQGSENVSDRLLSKYSMTNVGFWDSVY